MEIIAVADLRVGMFVVEPDCPWEELPFALQGFVISRTEQIDTFQEKCRFVYIDRSRSINEHYRQKTREKDRPLLGRQLQNVQVIEEPNLKLNRRSFFYQHGPSEQIKFRRQRFMSFLIGQDDSDHGRELAAEMAAIEPRFDDFQMALHTAFQQVESQQDIDLYSIQDSLHDMSGSLKRNPDALMWLLRLRCVDRYSFDHAVDVAVYLLLLGQHIGWRGSKLNELCLAGLLQDVGKIQLPSELLEKPGKLTPEEQVLIRTHVNSSLEILKAHAHLPTDVLEIVARHHERWDGNGYPNGLIGEQIGLGAQMAGLVDSFCAMLKNKPYRNALGHKGALEEIYQQREKHFNTTLMEQFVQCVGLYPIGTLVELNTEEVGVVIQQNRVQRSRPRILLLLDSKKNPVPGYQVIDLRDRSSKRLRISKALPPDAYGMSANDYYLR